MLNAQSMQTGDTRTARLVKSVLALLQFPRWLSYLSRRQKRKKHGLEINTNHFLQTGMPTHWEQDIVCCARHDRLQAVTFTLSPNFVRWCGWHFNQRMSFKPHCDKARWHTETKRELWVGYDMAEQAQHPFRVFFFFTWTTLRASLGYLQCGEKIYLQICNDSIISPVIFFNPALRSTGLSQCNGKYWPTV